MTYQISAKLLKTIAGLAVAATFLSACNSSGTPEIAAVPEPVVPTLPTVEEPISFNNTTATAPSTITVLETVGFFDGISGNSFYSNGPVAYNHLTSQATFSGNTIDVSREPGYKYVAFYTAGSGQIGLFLFPTETMPTAGTANYTGEANYSLSQSASTITYLFQPATMTANFAAGNIDIDVTGDNTIALRNLTIDNDFRAFFAQGSTTASIAGSGITDVPVLSIAGAGLFAGPTAQEAAGVFTLTAPTSTTEIDLVVTAKQ